MVVMWRYVRRHLTDHSVICWRHAFCIWNEPFQSLWDAQPYVYAYLSMYLFQNKFQWQWHKPNYLIRSLKLKELLVPLLHVSYTNKNQNEFLQEQWKHS